MKRESNEEKLEDVMKKLIRSYGLTRDYDDYQAIAAFKKVMGSVIANKAMDIQVKNKRMFVKLDSAVLREELAMGKSKIVQMINDEVGKPVVLDIVFV